MFLKIIQFNIIKMPVKGFQWGLDVIYIFAFFPNNSHLIWSKISRCISEIRLCCQKFFAKALCKPIWKIQYDVIQEVGKVIVLIRWCQRGTSLCDWSNMTPETCFSFSGISLCLPRPRASDPRGFQTIAVLHTDPPAYLSLTHIPSTDSHQTTPPNKGMIC